MRRGLLLTALAIAASGCTVVTRVQVQSDPRKGFFNSAVRPVAEDTGDIIGGNAMFKTPGIRNTELNGPYFHNGGMATLREVVEFYNRGGDFPSQFTDGQVRPLGLTETEKTARTADYWPPESIARWGDARW